MATPESLPFAFYLLHSSLPLPRPHDQARILCVLGALGGFPVPPSANWNLKIRKSGNPESAMSSAPCLSSGVPNSSFPYSVVAARRAPIPVHPCNPCNPWSKFRFPGASHRPFPLYEFRPSAVAARRARIWISALRHNRYHKHLGVSTKFLGDSLGNDLTSSGPALSSR